MKLLKCIKAIKKIANFIRGETIFLFSFYVAGKLFFSHLFSLMQNVMFIFVLNEHSIHVMQGGKIEKFNLNLSFISHF
jgi:hypothetical protein